MKVYQGIEAVDPPLTSSVLTIGNFDGVHRGHQQLLAQSGLFAANTGGPVVVLTFDPHPLSVIAPDRSPKQLCSLEVKIAQLGRAGADVVVVAKSGLELFEREAEDFIDDVIFKRFSPTHIVEGPNFRFGKGRRGTPELLKEQAARRGCEVHTLEPVHLEIDEGERVLVSSSVVRKLLMEGKIKRAALCLGRPYVLEGKVITGKGRGRGLGYPTANLGETDQLVPGDGVYAAVARLGVGGKERYPCALSVGRTPTFDDTGQAPRQVEAYLLDFRGNVYGLHIEIEFRGRLRDQIKFDSTEALIAQMDNDVMRVREEFAKARCE